MLAVFDTGLAGLISTELGRKGNFFVYRIWKVLAEADLAPNALFMWSHIKSAVLSYNETPRQVHPRIGPDSLGAVSGQASIHFNVLEYHMTRANEESLLVFSILFFLSSIDHKVKHVKSTAARKWTLN